MPPLVRTCKRHFTLIQVRLQEYGKSASETLITTSSIRENNYDYNLCVSFVKTSQLIA